MPSPRAAVLRLTVVTLALVLSAPVAHADHAHPPGPVNADTTYGWGMHAWEDPFVGPLKSFWKVRGRGQVQNQNGMLTLNTTRRGSVSATLERAGHRVGRWEIRLRSRRYSTSGANFKVRTELIPAGTRKQHCGARNVVFENYQLGRNRANLHIRNLPDLSFNGFKRLNLGNDRWHTFAVEITTKRISWFVDGHAITSERRSDALTGIPYTVKFTMKAKPGKRMNVSRMQMDWVRYYSLKNPNDIPVRAPRATRTTYAKAC